MVSFVLLDVERPTEVNVTIDHGSVSIDPMGIEAALGWRLESEGLCKDDVCIPVVGIPGLVNEGAIDLAALADLLGRPLALSVEEGAAYLGPPLALYDQTAGGLLAPDFTLPDLEGNLHSLSEHRGSKVLLAAWASW